MEITGYLGKGVTRFLSSTRTDAHAQYSPDGTKIAFESSRSGNSEIWVGNADGSNPFQLTFIGAPVSGLPRWSPDSKRIVFHSRPKGQADIFVIDAAGGPIRQLTNDDEEDVAPSWSRDGQWIYFDSQRSEQTEVWKIASDGGSPIQVTSNGGSMPLESLNGKFLYYSKTYTKPRTGASLWRMLIPEGKETLVIASLANETTYALTEDRIYFIGPDPSGTGMSIQFRESNSGAVTQIRRLERPIALGLSVSPDRRWILYNQMDQRTSDLMLVENLN
jgi:Tol biopolymer transport system component